MRLFRRGLVAVALVVAGATIIWGPAYARGLSLVVRAAHLDGWLKTAADTQAHPWTAGPATTVPTRHGDIPARLYRPAGTIRRAAILTPGVHAMGIDEPRLRGLAGDLAASGVADSHHRAARPRAVPLHRRSPSIKSRTRRLAGRAAGACARRHGRPDGDQLCRRPVGRRRGTPRRPRQDRVRLLLRRPRRPAAGSAVSVHGARAAAPDAPAGDAAARFARRTTTASR